MYLYSRNGLSSLSASLCGARLHGLILALLANHEREALSIVYTSCCAALYACSVPRNSYNGRKFLVVASNF